MIGGPIIVLLCGCLIVVIVLAALGVWIANGYGRPRVLDRSEAERRTRIASRPLSHGVDVVGTVPPLLVGPDGRAIERGDE